MFTICMGTGILAVLLHNNPYQFRGLGESCRPFTLTIIGTISVIMFILDLVLFTVISATFLTRWICFTRSTALMFESDVEQTTYLSTTTIAAATLTELVSLVCGSTWHSWQYVSFAFYWATVALTLVSATTTYWLLIRDEEVHLSNLSPTLMYPTTGLVATASSGSVLINYTPLSVGLSMPVLVVSYILLGAGQWRSQVWAWLILTSGFFLALLTITAYFTRLLSNQTPPAKKVAAQLIPVAALANAAYSYDTLGYLAGPKKHILEYYGRGPLADPAVGARSGSQLPRETLTGIVTRSGLLRSGLRVRSDDLGVRYVRYPRHIGNHAQAHSFWLLLCLFAFVRDLPKTNFNLNMWSAGYPLGAYGVTCSQLAIDFDSPTFRVVTSIILVVLVLYWLYLVVYTLPLVLCGELFLAEAVDSHEEEKMAQRAERERRSGSGYSGNDEPLEV